MEQIIVTHLDSSTTKLQSKENVSTITRANQNVELLGADTVEISVESANKLNFYIGDKITVIGRDYTLNTPAKERKLSERKFVYDMVFEGVQYDLLRVSYSVNVDTTSNQIQDLSGDSLTGDLKMFLDVLLSNANRVFPGKWVLGTYPTDTETKTLTFGDSDNCLSVLQSLCSEGNYNTEFSIGIAPNGVRTLNIGATGNVFPYTFQYGKGKGLYELTREKVSSTNIVTRLSVYGSSRNINTSKYRAFRLCLPGKTKGQSYLESATGIASYGVWEQTKNFEEIYPRRTGTISALGDSELKFVDSSMNFDLNEKDVSGNTLYLIPGAAAKIHFNTGNLAGYEFEITNYNHSIKTFTLRPFTDVNGYTFPSPTNAAFQFAQGDKYVILDIYLPQSYIDAAESELQAAGQEYLDKYSQPNVMYGLTVDPLFLKDVVGAEVEANIVWVGDYIPVKDTDLDVDKSIRVKGFTRDLLKDYAYSLTIADMAVTVSTISRVVSDLRGIDKVVRINNLNDPARARKNYLNSQEVLSMIFDQEGDYYTEKIKPLSIDTSMLSVGAKYMQFGMAGTIFQPNYAGAKNRVVYTGGSLTHYAILDSSDNPRTWTIGNGDVVLGTDAAYYIYAKCERTGVNGSILFSASQLLVDADTTYYHFLIGVINSVGPNNERAIALMYGFSAMNGRFIKTGRVQSADGNTYFDLDTGQIAGKISFSAGSSGYGNLEDAPDVAGMIDGIEIGGRNLTSGWEYEQTLPIASSSLLYKPLTFPDKVKGQQITVSFYGKSSNGTNKFYASIAANDSTRTRFTDYITLPTEYTKFVYTFVASSASDVNSLMFVYGTRWHPDNSGSISLREIKVELGNKATDWTPAPEDVQAGIDAASTAAANAQTSANTANALLADIASDSRLTPLEKQSTKQEWDIIVSEKVKIDAQADVYGVSKTAYGTAYTTLSNYITPLLSDLTTTSNIVGTTFRTNFKNYYDARQDILNAISSAARDLANAAQASVDLLDVSLSGAVFADTFNESQSQFDSRWTNYQGSGNSTIIQMSLATGGNVLAVGDNSGNDQVYIIGNKSIPYDPNKLYMVKARLRRMAGTGTAYVGIAGRDYTDTQWVNVTGNNSTSSQHYFAAAGVNPANEWMEYVGYFKGLAASGNGGVKPNPLQPGTCHSNVRFIRPLLILNYENQPGIVEVDYIMIDFADAQGAQAEIDAYSYLKEAMQNATDIQGGLLSTTLIKLGAVNQSGKWVEKAGINGAGTDDQTPRLYAGGTLQQAINRVAGQLTNAAKFVVTEGGKIFGMEAELFGSISTAPPGGKRIHLSQEVGAVNIHDETGRIKAAISAEPMPSLSSLLQWLTASANVAKLLQNSTHTHPVGTRTLTSNTTSIVLSELSASHTVTTPPVLCSVQAKVNTELGEASAYVRARLISENGYITLGSLSVSANSQIGNTDNSDSSTIPSQEISGLAPGTYYIQLYSEVYKKNADDFGSGEIEIKSPNDVLSSMAIADKSWIFNNGIYLVRDSNNYMYINPYGVKERFENAPDRPGVLASASVASGGTSSKAWGPKVGSSSNPSTGNYRIAHSIGHLNYNVLLTPLTAARIGYISTKEKTYVDVVLTNTSGTATNTAFDYCIIGDN